EAVARELEVADDLGIEERDRVGGDRVAKSRVKLCGDRRAADDSAPLEHDHLEPRRREIRGAYEAVVTAADDQGVGVPAGAGRHGWQDAVRFELSGDRKAAAAAATAGRFMIEDARRRRRICRSGARWISLM